MIIRAYLLAVLLALPSGAVAGPGDLPKAVAQVAISNFLAGRLSDACSDYVLASSTAKRALRAALAAEEEPKREWRSFANLELELGAVFLLAAERSYFKQMQVFPFDRPSACDAASKAVEDEQEIGRFLRRR